MERKNRRKWAPIVGRWSATGEPVRYLGPQPGIGFPFGICVTNVEFTGGRISTHVELSGESEGRILLGYRSPSERYLMVGIRGWDSAYTIGEFDPLVGWKALESAGLSSNIAPDHAYHIKVTLRGKRISLVVDDVRVLEYVLEEPLSSEQAGVFAWGVDPVTFTEFHVEREGGTVFVAMQFTEPYKQLYEEVILPAAQASGLRAYHVGEVFAPGMILDDITRGIEDATVVVAEITPSNQNVFYELGYAHALGKATILLAESGKQLPFDISGYRVLFYDNTEPGKHHLQEGLRKHFEAILRDVPPGGSRNEC